jgi:hypothetical protein
MPDLTLPRGRASPTHWETNRQRLATSYDPTKKKAEHRAFRYAPCDANHGSQLLRAVPGFGAVSDLQAALRDGDQTSAAPAAPCEPGFRGHDRNLVRALQRRYAGRSEGEGATGWELTGRATA